jgi:ribosomal silencing factor RsfS
MYKEHKANDIVIFKVQEVELSEEDMFIIEEQMKRDMLFCANWWKIQGRFNTAQYVKYLEYKASKA